MSEQGRTYHIQNIDGRDVKIYLHPDPKHGRAGWVEICDALRADLRTQRERAHAAERRLGEAEALLREIHSYGYDDDYHARIAALLKEGTA